MSGDQLVAVLAAVALLSLTATLEVASRAASRLDLFRWVQRHGDDESDETASWEQVNETLTVIRLARQLALVLVAVVLSSLGPAWFGVVDETGRRIIIAAGLSLAAYLLIDKALAFALVTVLGPLGALTLGRPLIVLLAIVFGRPARLLGRFHRDSRARDEPAEVAVEDGDLDAFIGMAGESGLVSEHDEALLRGVAEFSEVDVDHVMTPRVDIVSITESATLRELTALVAEHKHSRIPVIRDNIDEVAGIVNIRELVAALEQQGGDAPVKEIVRPALFVPETKRVSALLREFQKRHEHLAIVVDEYGGTAGLVTIEDLLEEIVGEIQDEVEDEEQTIVRLADGAVMAEGKAEIEDIEQALGVSIGDDEFETVSGMAFMHFGYVPKSGESFEQAGVLVEVLEADERRVHRVKISATQPTTE